MLNEEFEMLSTDTVSLSPNPLVQALRKPAKELTKADIIGYIEDNHIPMLNLRYVGGDGRLKTLNFAIQSKAHLDRVLTLGERVDGSSLFTFVEATSSDLYVVPRLSTAFLNPFSSIPTLEFLCNFYDVSGAPWPRRHRKSSEKPNVPSRRKQAAHSRRSANWNTTSSPRRTPSSVSSPSAATTNPGHSRSGRTCVHRPFHTW